MSEAKSEVIGWVVLELMGHRRLGGFLRPVEIAGKGFLRIDVPTPATKDESGPWLASQLYSPDAVYCITPTTIEVAKVAAASSTVEPVSRWELPEANNRAPTQANRRPFIGDTDDYDDKPF